MKNGECPNCKSEAVVMSARGVGYSGFITFKFGRFFYHSTPNWTTYLCLDCGYFENYVTNKKKLDKIKANVEKMGWKKVEKNVHSE